MACKKEIIKSEKGKLIRKWSWYFSKLLMCVCLLFLPRVCCSLISWWLSTSEQNNFMKKLYSFSSSFFFFNFIFVGSFFFIVHFPFILYSALCPLSLYYYKTFFQILFYFIPFFFFCWFALVKKLDHFVYWAVRFLYVCPTFWQVWGGETEVVVCNVVGSKSLSTVTKWNECVVHLRFLSL